MGVAGPDFAAALSEHPVPAHATGEVVGQVLEAIGTGPDLAMVFVTPPQAGALEDIAGAVASTLAPTVLVGCAAESVIGTGREVEQEAAVALWAGRPGPAVPVHLSDPTEPLPVLEGASAVILVADPFSFDGAAALAELGRHNPGLPVLGGMASGARGPGGSRLVLGDRVFTSGAVGAVLGTGRRASAVVSQGCRPVGSPWAVTRAEGSVIYELAGRPALARLMEVVENELSPADVAVINRGGLTIGIVVDEHRAEFGRGDFLIRNVRGADRSNGAIAIAAEVEIGTTVQFHLQDAAAADEDLRVMLSGHQASSALVFSCNGRGTRLFGRPDHDAAVVAEVLGEVPTAGFFAAGEFGPIGGRNFLHGFTTSILLFP